MFQNAFTPNSKCAPSRSIILTGRNSWQLEEAANHWASFPDKFKSFFEVLGENGYRTGHVRKGWGPGKVGMVNGQRRKLTGQAFNEATLDPPTPYISPTDYATNFELFLKDQPSDQPFCFWYGSIEPHRAYEFGSGVKLGNMDINDVDDIFGFFSRK